MNGGWAELMRRLIPRRAIDVYKKILESLPSNLNHYNEIILKHLIAQQYDNIGNRKAMKLFMLSCDESPFYNRWKGNSEAVLYHKL